MQARFLLVICVAYGLFANHWSRDTLGALEVPLETDEPYALSVREYNLVTSVYFSPNLCVPLIAGVVAQRFGSARTYVAFFLVAAAGNAIVATSTMGTNATSFPLLLVGRSLMGVAYEAVDMLPIGFLAPRFPDSWATICGMLNGVNRLGSVLNFLLEPVFYHAGGALLLTIWTTDHLPQTTDRCSPPTTHRPPPTAHRSPLTAHRSPLTTHRSPLTTHVSPLVVHHATRIAYHPLLITHHPLLTAQRSPLVGHRSPFIMHRSPFAAHRAPLTTS